jgi:hypothetical protein
MGYTANDSYDFVVIWYTEVNYYNLNLVLLS